MFDVRAPIPAPRSIVLRHFSQSKTVRNRHSIDDAFMLLLFKATKNRKLINRVDKFATVLFDAWNDNAPIFKCK